MKEHSQIQQQVIDDLGAQHKIETAMLQKKLAQEEADLARRSAYEEEQREIREAKRLAQEQKRERKMKKKKRGGG